MKKLMQDRGIPVLQLKITGRNKLGRVLSSILLGSYVGYYLALHYDRDPSPVPMVEEFKRLLKQ